MSMSCESSLPRTHVMSGKEFEKRARKALTSIGKHTFFTSSVAAGIMALFVAEMVRT